MVDTSKHHRKKRVIVLGEHGCAKSDLLAHFCADGQSIKKQKKTIGCEIFVKYIHLSPYWKDSVEFWDFSGDCAEQDFCQIYFQLLMAKKEEILGIIYIFDAQRPRTFHSIGNYLKKIFQKKPLEEKQEPYNCDFLESINIPLFVIGNKFEKVGRGDVQKMFQSVKKSLDALFEEDASKIELVYYSQGQQMSEYKQLNKFLQDCILGGNSLKDHYLYNPLNPLYLTDKYKKKTYDVYQGLRKEVKEIASGLKTFVLYCPAFILAQCQGLFRGGGGGQS